MLKNNLRIGIFWEQFEWGGVDTHIKYLLESWINSDDRFTIYFNSENKGAIRLKNEMNAKDIIFKEHNSLFTSKGSFFSFLVNPIKYIISIFKYCKILKHEKLDVIICQNGGYPAAYGVLAAIAAAYKVKIPARILVIHHQARKPILFTSLFRGFVDKITSKVSSSIVCVSKATLESLKKSTFLLENENIHSVVIDNWVPTFKDKEKKNLFDKKDDEKLIGVLGRIEEYKGHRDLIYSFSKLPDKIKKTNKILIIGKGSDENTRELKTIIRKLNLENEVLLKGYVEDKIENIISSIDLLVMPTRSFEGFGYVIAEAMGIGTPVLASNVGAIKEFLSKEEGEIFEPGNINQLAECIIDFNNNNKKWIEKSKKAKIKIIEKFNPKKTVSEFRNHIYQKYLEGTK